jgi:RHS repeat-associated protein
LITPSTIRQKTSTFFLGKPREKVKSKSKFLLHSYRYGFNGQEKDNEIKGVGNSVNYRHRMEDTRLCRFFAVDPIAKEYPELTTYQVSSLNPIENIELEGLEGKSTHSCPALNTPELDNIDPLEACFKNIYEFWFTNKTSSETKFNAVFPDKTILAVFKLMECAGINGVKVNYTFTPSDYIEMANEVYGYVSAANSISKTTITIPKFTSPFLKKINPFKGLDPGQAGALGEKMMVDILVEKYKGQNVTIVEQMYAKSGKTGTYIDATVVYNSKGIILEVAESKYNTSKIKPGTGQDLMYNDGTEFTTSGKVAKAKNSENLKVDKNTSRSVYSWSEDGSVNVSTKKGK